ncbi:hypothetical protein [Bradyrhizobium lablabi]|uniref:hypothetical protein n=1 Tax=Bradyrhizobium lablabi TaxID=722472 RepID=UPI001BA4CE8C|nr:hypothetical protein [Bradyrhizobium lablabi]MBR0693405.1 hypothetical protein [Bradyrhizobium lablabi]
MPQLNACLQVLHRLIAEGDVKGVPIAERAINEYLDATPDPARRSGLRLIQQFVLVQRDAVAEHQQGFADAIIAYIEGRPAA